MRIARKIAIGQNILPQWLRVLNSKTNAPKHRGYGHTAIGSRFQNQFTRVRLKSKIATANLKGLAQAARCDLGTDSIVGMMTTIGTVDPIVEAISQTI